jgi:hypothetical protein
MTYFISIPQQFSRSGVDDIHLQLNANNDDVVDIASSFLQKSIATMQTGSFHNREFFINDGESKVAYRKIKIDFGIKNLQDNDIQELFGDAVTHWAGNAAIKGKRGRRSYIFEQDQDEDDRIKIKDHLNDADDLGEFPAAYDVNLTVELYVGTTVMFNYRRGTTNVGLTQEEVVQDLDYLVDTLNNHIEHSECELKFTYEDNDGKPVSIWF